MHFQQPTPLDEKFRLKAIVAPTTKTEPVSWDGNVDMTDDSDANTDQESDYIGMFSLIGDNSFAQRILIGFIEDESTTVLDDTDVRITITHNNSPNFYLVHR